MPINPVQFAHHVCDDFLRYLFSAFPLTDPDLKGQFERLLERPSSLDIPLVRGPYISLSEAFAEGDEIQGMAVRGILHPLMPEIIGYERMYRHQEAVFEAVRQERHVLISTGTGSGKTEAFLYPIVDDLLRQRDEGIREGVAAVLVYPMNALGNDQLDRLREMLGGTGITFGLWTGSTPDSEKNVRVDRFEGSSRDAYLAARKKRLEEALKDDRAAKPLAPPEECCSEDDIRGRKPRILLTNYRQLEILLTRLPDLNLFSDSPLKYIVFDEVHGYEGATGAEVACLIRRLRTLAGKKPNEAICIGTSATLTNPLDDADSNEEAVRRFAGRFFGVDPTQTVLVGESYVERKWPSMRHRPPFPQGDVMNLLGRTLDALTEPAKPAALEGILAELCGKTVTLGRDWQHALHTHLIGNEYVYQCAQVLDHPLPLQEAVKGISEAVSPGGTSEGPNAQAELLVYLALAAAASDSGNALLRPKVHFFIRGLDEMVAAFDGDKEATTPRLFMSIREAKEACPERRDDAFWPVLTCRSCGQHFFENYYLELKLAQGSGKKIKGIENGDATEDGDGQSNAVWSPATKEQGNRLVLTNRLLEEAESGEDSSRRNRYLPVWLCRQCGALHRQFSNKCQANGCGHEAPVLPMLLIGDQVSSCPSCGTVGGRIGGQVREPVRPIRAVTVADVHILAQSMINAAPERHKRLIIFADSRQDAAFQAGWMRDHARRIRLRRMIYEVMTQTARPMHLDEITDRLKEAFVKDKSLIDVLLPELTQEDAQAIFGHDMNKSVYRALRYLVYREFTAGIRRRECLESMGLALTDYRGLTGENEKVRDWAALMGINAENAVNSIALLLDLWRRARVLYVPNDPIFSQYHAKDDPYVQAGLLPLKEFRPEGVKEETGPKDKYARGFISSRGAVHALLRKWNPKLSSDDLNLAIKALWRLLTEELGLLKRVTLRSQKEKPLADVYQVDADKIAVSRISRLVRCKTCQRVTTRMAANGACTRHHCKGQTVQEEPDTRNYDVALMGRPFTMVSAEEHTAQVPGEYREKIEQEFKSKGDRTNCLVATPTLEMGVDIGALDMVLMRNVPPKTSNYWQRAGRAGRQVRMAVIVTHCRRSPHDRYYFDNPLRLLDGRIEIPAFNLYNPLMVEKHIRSAVLSELLLLPRGNDDQGSRIRDVLKTLFPFFVRGYLLSKDDAFLNEPPSVAPLKSLLGELEEPLVGAVRTLFAQHWPDEAGSLTSEEAIRATVQTTGEELSKVLGRLHKRFAWARHTQEMLHRHKEKRLLEREEEHLLRRCDDFIQAIIRYDRSTYTLSVLGFEGFLPGYGVYEGGVTASVRRGFSRLTGPKLFDLSRSAPVALREFVPGNRLYANLGSYYVTRYHLGVDEAANIQALRVDPEKGFVTEAKSGSSYGHELGTIIDALPLTDLDLVHEGRITEEENLRFSMPVLILGRLRKKNRGGKAYKIGDREVHHLKGQGIELVNVGEAARARKGLLGHLICPVCGAAKTPYAVPQEINRFVEIHQKPDRCGKAPLFMALTAQSDVDLLQFFDVKDDEEAINIGEALRLAGSRVLDMGVEDLQTLLVRNMDESLCLLLYDPMPGGSGLLDQMLSRWEEVLGVAQETLEGCADQCETACYSCMKTFRNQFYHPLLDRRKAVGHLARYRHRPNAYRDISPLFEEHTPGVGTPSNTREGQLVRILMDHHFPPGVCRQEIQMAGGALRTTPDWLYEDATDAKIKVAVYQDGMSRGLHGDPKRAQQDQLIRQMLEIEGFKVIIIQSRDLDDPQAIRQHLVSIATAIGKESLARAIENR